MQLVGGKHRRRAVLLPILTVMSCMAKSRRHRPNVFGLAEAEAEARL
jgi:hypothetical protein